MVAFGLPRIWSVYINCVDSLVVGFLLKMCIDIICQSVISSVFPGTLCHCKYGNPWLVSLPTLIMRMIPIILMQSMMVSRRRMRTVKVISINSLSGHCVNTLRSQVCFNLAL